MDIPAVIGMATTLIATGAAATVKGIEALLTELMMYLKPRDKSAWVEIFKLLGEQHPGTQRFQIIYGVFLVIREADDKILWLTAWVEAIQAARIHPLSVPLCATYQDDWLRRATLEVYNNLYPNSRKFPKIIDMKDTKHKRCGNFTQIEIPADCSVTNLVSSVDLLVGEQRRGSICSIGMGWCVQGLALLEMPSLVEIGPNLVVITHLHLGGLKKSSVIHDDSKVGGVTMVWANNSQGWTSDPRRLPGGNWDNGVGIRQIDMDFSWCRSGGLRAKVDELSNPIILPDCLIFLQRPPS